MRTRLRTAISGRDLGHAEAATPAVPPKYSHTFSKTEREVALSMAHNFLTANGKRLPWRMDSSVHLCLAPSWIKMKKYGALGYHLPAFDAWVVGITERRRVLWRKGLQRVGNRHSNHRLRWPQVLRFRRFCFRSLDDTFNHTGIDGPQA